MVSAKDVEHVVLCLPLNWSEPDDRIFWADADDTLHDVARRANNDGSPLSYDDVVALRDAVRNVRGRQLAADRAPWRAPW